VKRKPPGGLKSQLWKTLLPEIEVSALAQGIAEFSNTPAGRATEGKDFANILAAYLAQKYWITDRKSGELRLLIEHNSDQLAAFLDEMSFKRVLRCFKQPPYSQQTSTNNLLSAIMITLDDAKPLQKKLPPPDEETSRTKKRRRRRPKTESDRLRRRKLSKDDYEYRRRRYRRGLIVQEFGTYPFPKFYPAERTPPQGECLDVLFRGGSVRMAAEPGSLEDLFGLDRKRFPKSLRYERNGRNTEYPLKAFIKCMIYLLTDRDGKEPWLPGAGRNLVLQGIIARARQISSKISATLAKNLRPYLS
jgi:hypothetical protein